RDAGHGRRGPGPRRLRLRQRVPGRADDARREDHPDLRGHAGDPARRHLARDGGLVPTLLLVRHGQASFGTADYDVLSDLRHRQAEVTAAAVAAAGYRTTLVVSGSLRRQRDTAAPFGEPEIDPRWDEYDAEDVIAHHSSSTARLVSTGGGEE